MNLQSSDFEIFGLAPAFGLDRGLLDERWKALQRQVHPDRHAAADAQTQRQAMQWSVRINEAYQRLRDPVRRAAYLCELHGVPVDAERNTSMPPEFLAQQLAWREALEEATTLDALQAMADDVEATRAHMLEEVRRLADDARDYVALAALVRALMFVDKFARDVEARIDELGQ